MTVTEAFKSAFEHSFNWKGRASRTAFWWAATAVLALNSVILIVLSMLLSENGVASFLALLVLLLFLPCLASVTVRRLHDAGYSGWWILLAAAMAFIILWLFAREFVGGWLLWLALSIGVSGVLGSDPSANRYGPPAEGRTSEPQDGRSLSHESSDST